VNKNVKITISGKLKVYTAGTGGTQVSTGTTFSYANLPTNLWVEGSTASSKMADANLVVNIEGAGGSRDKVKFTVLWVDSFNRRFADATPQYGSVNAADYAGDDVVSDDNDKKQDHNDQHTYPDLAHLGLNKDMTGPHMGWMFEVEAVVHPNNLDPSKFPDLSLEQDIEYKNYKGTNVVDSGTYTNSGSVISNDGPGPIFWQDVTPSAAGKIYFLDSPGPPWANVYGLSSGDVLRTRNNFRAWARYGNSKCSRNFEYYVKFDLERQLATPEWQVLNNGNKDSQNNAQTALDP